MGAKALTSLAVVLVVTLVGAGQAWSQNKQKFFFKAPPGATRYTQTHLMDVNDVPGHQLRMAEVTSKYAAEAPVYNGVKVVTAISVLVSDYTEGSGRAFSYTVQTLETGDKVFLRTEILAHSTAAADGARRTSFTQVATITGGTGGFKGIRGTLRTSGATDLKTGTSGTETEGEYWFEK